MDTRVDTSVTAIPLSNEKGIHIESLLQQNNVPSFFVNNQQRSLPRICSLPFLALLIFIYLFISFCRLRSSSKRLKSKPFGRRLASNDQESDDEFPSPSSPDLDLLCSAAAREGSPSESSSSPSDPRASPQLVQLFFEELESPASSSEEGDADAHDGLSPARKLLKTQQGREPVAPPGPSSAAGPSGLLPFTACDTGISQVKEETPST